MAVKQPKFDNSFTVFSLTKLVNRIAQSPYCNLEEEFLMQDLINYQWKNTLKYQKVFFGMYLFGYMIPFYLQLVIKNYAFNMTASITCMIQVIVLFCYNFVQC